MNDQDVLVVGGGVVGLTLAEALTRQEPGLRVTVLEQHGWGSGATGYAGAVDIPYAHTPFHRELVEAGRQWWTEFEADAPAPGARTALPFAWLVRGPEAAGHLADTLVTPARPVAAPADGAWRLPAGTTALAGEAHVIDPRRLTAALVRRLAARPRVRLVEHRRVTELTPAADGVRAATADGGRWRAERCVLALGPWLPSSPLRSALRPAPGPAGPEADVRTKRVYGLRVALSGPAAVRYGVGSAEDGIFLFPVADGEFAMSVKHDVWDVPPEERPLPADVRARAAAFLDAVVGPGTWAVTRGRVFADTYTPDATPRLLPLSPADGVFAVTGLHGSGVRLAAGLAAHAARAVLAHRRGDLA
ncbi:NAD(P)/FAD-dependent oxidoreductase [Streptomyces bangladeshensis]|uniref:FAD dependent oxidoreductase domain-containing protein n=1 Tax=Streptomyces bangladeshensis TaxID=295352 RepID=A0ABN3BPH0_9ACTN